MSRARLGLLAGLLATACFDGEGLRGAPCLGDDDCGPKLRCVGPEGAGICGGPGSGGTVGSRWPDSPSVLCTDGTNELETCPEPGFLGYGQDGNYQIAVPSYEESDGIVTDSVARLDWEASSTPSAYTQQAAIDRCANLQLDGRSWRLPSRLELASLLDYGRDVPFSDLQPGAHWTSSAAGGAEAWVINFVSWSTTVFAPTDEAFVICVTGEPLVSSFAMTSETIRDALTGLEWQRQQISQTLPWTEALAHCEGLELAGRSDWRLPSAKELVTLVRDDREPVAGLDADVRPFWSSSPDWPPDRAVTVVMPDGITGSDTTNTPNYARCVRGPD